MRRALLLSVCVMGCDDGAPATPALRCEPVLVGAPRPLIHHDNWRVATPEEDPWLEHRPADITCPAEARKPEDFAGTYAYSITTVACPYTTMVQETLADACKGETFYVWLWNYGLTAPENATAHIGVQLGSTVFAATRAIPSPSALTAETLILEEDVPKGTPIFFHVRNHGANSYELLDLIIVAPGDAPRP